MAGAKRLQVIGNELWEADYFTECSEYLASNVDAAVYKLACGESVYCVEESVESIRQKLRGLGVYITETGNHEAS